MSAKTVRQPKLQYHSPLLIPPMRGLCPALLVRQGFRQMLRWVGFASHLSSWLTTKPLWPLLFLLRWEHKRQGTIELRWIRQRRISAIGSCSCCSFTGYVKSIQIVEQTCLGENQNIQPELFRLQGRMLLEVWKSMIFHLIFHLVFHAIPESRKASKGLAISHQNFRQPPCRLEQALMFLGWCSQHLSSKAQADSLFGQSSDEILAPNAPVTAVCALHAMLCSSLTLMISRSEKDLLRSPDPVIPATRYIHRCTVRL